MAFLPLLALLIIPTQSSAFIDKIVTLATQPARAVCRMLGDDHSHDRPNHRSTIKSAVQKRVKRLEHRENPRPLTLHIEDPSAHPEIEKLFPIKGVLPGLVKELNQMALPSHTIVKNFDERKITSVALKWLNPAGIPYALKDAHHLKDYTFGHVVTEMEKGLARSERRVDSYVSNAKTSWIKTDLTKALARITTGIEQFTNKLIATRISASDSILNTGINLFAHEATSSDECKSYAKNKNKQELASLLHDGCQSTEINPSIEEITAWYNPVSARALISKPLYDASLSLVSTDAFFAVTDTPGDSALIAGSHHANDVSDWLIDTEQWGQSPIDAEFNDNWLLNASAEELEAEYSNHR